MNHSITKKRLQELAGLNEQNENNLRDLAKQSGLSAAGYYWYKGKLRTDWTVVEFEGFDPHEDGSPNNYPFNFIASDEIYRYEEVLPGQFVGPLKHP